MAFRSKYFYFSCLSLIGTQALADASMPPQLTAPETVAPAAAIPSKPSASPAAMPMAAAPVPVDSRTPFVIIRFNQPRLEFRQALSNAVASANAAKQDVAFDVVLHPASDAQNTGNAHLLKVTSGLRELGVPASRIVARQAEASNARYDEVFVYVR